MASRRDESSIAWRGVPWCATPVVVLEDRPELLVTYLPEEAPFAFPPSADGRPHPWQGRRAWAGHGVLMLRRPGDELLAERVLDGRYTDEQVAATRAIGQRLGAMLDHGERWWHDGWAGFDPDPAWRAPAFPDAWEEAPVAPVPPPTAYRLLSL